MDNEWHEAEPEWLDPSTATNISLVHKVYVEAYDWGFCPRGVPNFEVALPTDRRYQFLHIRMRDGSAQTRINLSHETDLVKRDLRRFIRANTHDRT